MNNKYDVKNFADLLDNFNVEDEMKAIALTPRGQAAGVSGEIYKFNPYTNQRYNLNELYGQLRFDP